MHTFLAKSVETVIDVHCYFRTKTNYAGTRKSECMQNSPLEKSSSRPPSRTDCPSSIASRASVIGNVDDTPARAPNTTKLKSKNSEQCW